MGLSATRLHVKLRDIVTIRLVLSCFDDTETVDARCFFLCFFHDPYVFFFIN